MLNPGDMAVVKTLTSDIHEHTNDLKTVKGGDSQLLFGERFSIELIDGDWVFGQSLNDGYEGFVALNTLKPYERESTHFVSHILSHIYPEPTFKIRPDVMVSFKSEIVCSDRNENGFFEVPDFGWIPEGHITAVNAPKGDDLAATALKFEGMPYLFGGRSSNGIDCSGLTQTVLQFHGHKSPRDSGPQLRAGVEGKPEDGWQCGDLVFFKGHVGIMIDDENILNATARTMDTRIEKLSDLSRIYDGGILGYRRI